MTAQEAKAKVLEIWPEAQESFFGDQYSDGIEIWSDRYSEGGEEIGGGRRMTSDEAWIDAASRLPVEPKAQVGSASVEKNNPVLDAEPKSGVRLNKPSEAKATLMTEGRTGTANVPTGTKIEPKEAESGGLMDLNDYESMYANAVGELKAEQEAHQASLLREQKLKELLGEAANAIARHWDITDQAAKDVALKARAAAVKGE